MKTKFQWKTVYLFALLPLLGVGILLLLMSLGFAEPFQPVGLAMFVLYSLLWGFVGSLFARNGVTMGRAILISHILPFFTGAVYTVLAVIATLTENAALLNSGEVIGILGSGVFSIFGTILYAIIPLELFEVYVDLIFSVLVFSAGFALAPFGRAKRK